MQNDVVYLNYVRTHTFYLLQLGRRKWKSVRELVHMYSRDIDLHLIEHGETKVNNILIVHRYLLYL